LFAPDLTFNSNITIAGNLTIQGNSDTISGSTGSFTYLNATNLSTGNAAFTGAISATALNATPIGGTTPSTGAFTTLSTTGNATVGGTLGVTGALSASSISLGANGLAFDPLAVQSAAYITAVDTGVANAYACALTPAPAAYTPGMMVFLDNIGNTNTGAATANINGLGALPIQSAGAVALQGGELVATYGALLRVNHAATALELLMTTGGSLPVAQGSKSEHAVNLGQFLAPAVSQYDGLVVSGSAASTSVSVTAPCKGTLLCIGALNVAQITTTYQVYLNGSAVDQNNYPNVELVPVALTAGQAYTSTFWVTNTGTTSAQVSMRLACIFIPTV
jgi:hypothetical protein